jgi:hypothetical protein
MDAAALKDEIRKIVSSGNLNMSLSECRQLLEKNLGMPPLLELTVAQSWNLVHFSLGKPN